MKNSKKKHRKFFNKIELYGIKRTEILYRFKKSQHTLVSKCIHKKLEANEVITDSEFLSPVRKKLITFFRCFIHTKFFPNLEST